MVALALPPLLAAAFFIHRALQPRRIALALALSGMLVFGGYALDRLYVRAHPEWNAFYFYNQTAMQIQDSHRLENMDFEIRHIGWSGNDQELFARYFFPDAGTYSIDRLRFLVDKIPGIGQDWLYTAGAFLERVKSERAAPPLLACAAAAFLLLGLGGSAVGKIARPLVAAAALAENLALMFIYKNPDYVLLSSLANAAILSALVLLWPAVGASGVPAAHGERPWVRATVTVGLLTAALAVGGSARLSVRTSNNNTGKQAGYARVLADIDELRRRGALAPNPVILSASHGIPWDWSNPLLTGFPDFTYLDTGWNTFSPYYEEAIRNHNVEPVLEALYTRDNVYLISKSVFKDYLARYYEEHVGLPVTFETIYMLPNPNHYDGYDGVELYKVVQAAEGLP